MDPLTHGILGAALAQTVTPARATRAERGRAALVGAAAGVLPDADIFFRPWTDPALPWEAHRYFTHALAFAPIGGLVALLPFLLFRRMRERCGRLSAAAILAYASHGLLDACTSYGTHLFLPFSAARVSWDLIGIIDPMFTATLAAGVALTFLFAAQAGFLSRPSLATLPAVGALLLGAAYLALGARQHAIALGEIERDAASAGRVIEHARAMPSPGGLRVWRGLYLASGRIYVEGGWVPLFGAPSFRSGGSLEAFTPASLEPAASDAARRARIADIAARFDRFADGFAARDPAHPDVLADMRYSIGTTDFRPLWGIRLNPAPGGEPVAWVDLVNIRDAARRRLLGDGKRD